MAAVTLEVSRIYQVSHHFLSNVTVFRRLSGIISKLDHFVDVGLEVLYISPHYRSPMKDMGYDVSDYKSVNPLFGTMEDFDELLRKLAEKGI